MIGFAGMRGDQGRLIKGAVNALIETRSSERSHQDVMFYTASSSILGGGNHVWVLFRFEPSR